MKQKNKKSLIKSIKERDPAARSSLQIFLTYPGVKAMVYHRIAHFFYTKLHLKLIGELLAKRARHITGIEIHPAAKIGQRVFIDHGMGVVIGETADIGDDCLIYHGVTLGALTGKNIKTKRHPTIGSRVIIGANATILGPVTISDDAKVGANAFVITDVGPSEVVRSTPTKQKSCKQLHQ